MKIIAQMVGRNEADRYLVEVLDHLRPIVDEIVFTDDCSDDNTPQVVSKYTPHVFSTSEPLFSVHEGRLRTEAWQNLSRIAQPEDWILAIDCDEKLWSAMPDMPMGRLLTQNDYDVLNIVFYHMWNKTHYRIDKAWRPSGSFRMFRYFYGGQFKDKKLASGSEPTYVETLVRRGRYMRDTGLVMQHLGYLKDADKQAKHARYMELDHGNFHSITHLESILDKDPTLEPWQH